MEEKSLFILLTSGQPGLNTTCEWMTGILTSRAAFSTRAARSTNSLGDLAYNDTVPDWQCMASMAVCGISKLFDTRTT
jgi:hypothetical protein